MLNLLNHLNRADRQFRQGQWSRESNRGHELAGMTVGIIGYGHMGRAFARTLRGFDCRVLCHDIIPGDGDKNAQQVPLEELSKKAQVVSLHTPLTPETNGMVNKNFPQSVCPQPLPNQYGSRKICGLRTWSKGLKRAKYWGWT